MKPHILPNCPWYDSYLYWGTPNIRWCEDPVCSIIANPANTWSNSLFILIGIIYCWKAIRLQCKFTTIYGVMMLAVGITSLIWHASLNLLTQYVDFIGMFCFLAFAFFISLLRIKNEDSPKFAAIGSICFFLALNGAFWIFHLYDLKYQFLVHIAVIVIVFTEYLCHKNEKRNGPLFTHSDEKTNFKYCIWAIVFLILGQIASFLDVNRILCDPDNHFIQGHAIWHILSGVSLWLYFLFARQFRWFNSRI